MLLEMSSALPDGDAVVDASALVAFLLRSADGSTVATELGQFSGLHAPAHVDAETLSALGRLHRAGDIAAHEVASRLELLRQAPIARHPLADLLVGAWARRDRFRLVDALYVELADRLGATLITVDRRLAAAAGVVPAGG